MNHSDEINEIRGFIDLSKGKKLPHKDDIFDLDKIPMEVLDKLWLPLSSYNLGLPHRHPLRRVVENVNFRENIDKVKEVITSTYDIDKSLFVIRKGCNGMYAAILMSLNQNNIETIENAMLSLDFYRSNPTDTQLLEDKKNRKYITLRFEPTQANDLTRYVRKNYKYLYHATPSMFEDKIKTNGLNPSNNNSEFRYNEPRVYVMKGNISESDKQELINTLYQQAKQRIKSDLSPNYSIFTIDINKIPKDVRFYGDINEDNGIFITNKISPNAFVNIEHYIANELI